MASARRLLIGLCALSCAGRTVAVPSRLERFDCYPEAVANQSICLDRGCLWTNVGDGGPKCYYGNDYGYEVIEKQSIPLGQRYTLKRHNKPPRYNGNAEIANITLDVEYHKDDRLRFKFYDAAQSRFEVPIEYTKVNEKAKKPQYQVLVPDSGHFTIKVKRVSTGAVIFDTSVSGGFTFSNQFLQLSTKLPTENVYGFGENEHKKFKHINPESDEVYPMFTMDRFPHDGGNLYGVHPFYMALEKDSKAHGVFLKNSNAMEVVLGSLPSLTYRTIGGVLDFYMFMGPTPDQVVQQYTELIGNTFMPPYWSLGFQLCRWGYNSLTRVKEVVDGMKKYQIPQDVQYGDIDYMVRQLDFTYDKVRYKDWPEFVKSVKKEGLRYIVIKDPAIGMDETNYEPFKTGQTLDIWVKDHTKTATRIGKVWPTKDGVVVNSSLPWDEQTRLYRTRAAFPDYFHSKAGQWWCPLLEKFQKEINFDGLWVDMNEPANFVNGDINGCPVSGNTYDYPFYKPAIAGNPIFQKTICMKSYQGDSQQFLHYDVHSLYGWSMAKVSEKCMEEIFESKKRPMVLSRSTFAGSGKYAGHWLGDNTASWNQLKYSIIGMLEFNLFGIPYIGADICGFFGAPSPELCLRWMQLGAFYPFSRNHNGNGYSPQDPAAFGAEFAKDSRQVLETRYTLLPYLYTLFFEAHTAGATVVKSLMHEFTSDPNTWTIDEQFLWGPGLLISPVVYEGKTTVRAYVPDSRWYDYYTGKEVAQSSRKKWVTWNAPREHINLHVRGGRVLPTQEPANNTMFSRRKPLGLIVALDEEGKAEGQLFWDDGEGLDTIAHGKYVLARFTASESELQIALIKNNYTDPNALFFGKVSIYGAKGRELLSSGVISSKETKHTKYEVSYDSSLGVLTFSNLALKLTEEHKLKWELSPVKSRALANVPQPESILLILLTSLIFSSAF